MAGPIERAKNLLGQMYEAMPITREHITQGLSLFLIGLFKKLAMADLFGSYVNEVYGMPGEFNAPALICATFAFSWQIYCDFSGYTDMARGVARMMSFNLMQNFNNPYLSASLGEFWGRWHISLSTWFRDYVYIPLGGNRFGPARTYFNMIMTMVISGFWHGANWTFLVWGVAHAGGRVVTRELEKTSIYKNKVPKIVKQLGIFVFVMLTWVFFRAEDMTEALLILERIFTTPWTDPQFPPQIWILCFALWGYQYACESKCKKYFKSKPVQVALALAMIFYMCFFTTVSDAPFIYFQF